MDGNKIVNHYMSVSRQLRDGLLTQDELQVIMNRDAQGYLAMFNKGLMNNEEYDSILKLVSTYEDMFEEIIIMRQN